MKKKISIIYTIAFIVVIVLTITLVLDNSHKVDFEDETMAEMIAKTTGVEKADKLRADDLEKVEILNIGYTGYYDTLTDIEKCPNLKRLFISCPEDTIVYYPFAVWEMPEPESQKRVKQIEKELESILEKCSILEDIYMSNENGNCELDNIEFLKKGKNHLIAICLFYQTEIDYSPISECKELEYLSLRYCDVSDLSMLSELEELKRLNLEGTNIADVEELLKLKNLNNLVVLLADTPLAEKTEELENLQQQFPGLDIRLN